MNRPRPNTKHRMSFLLHDRWFPRNSQKAIDIMAMSDVRLKTALVMRWLVAAEHCGFGVGTAQ